MAPLASRLLVGYLSAILLAGSGYAMAQQETAVPASSPSDSSDYTMEWLVFPGETLNGLAALFYPDNRLMQQRFVAATLKLNQEHHVIANVNASFVETTQILVPDIQYFSQYAVKPAPKTAFKSNTEAKASAITQAEIKTIPAPDVDKTKAIPNVSTHSTVLMPVSGSEVNLNTPVNLQRQYDAVAALNASQKQDLEQLNKRFQDMQQQVQALSLELQKSLQQEQAQQEAANAKALQAQEQLKQVQAPVTMPNSTWAEQPASDVAAVAGLAGAAVNAEAKTPARPDSRYYRNVTPTLSSPLSNSNSEADNPWAEFMFPGLLTLMALLTLGLMVRWKVNPWAKRSSILTALPPPIVEFTPTYQAKRRATDHMLGGDQMLRTQPNAVAAGTKKSIQNEYSSELVKPPVVPMQPVPTASETIQTQPAEPAQNNAAIVEKSIPKPMPMSVADTAIAAPIADLAAKAPLTLHPPPALQQASVQRPSDALNPVADQQHEQQAPSIQARSLPEQPLVEPPLSKQTLAKQAVELSPQLIIPPAVIEQASGQHLPAVIQQQAEASSMQAVASQAGQVFATGPGPEAYFNDRPALQMLTSKVDTLRQEKQLDAALKILQDYINAHPAQSVLPWLQLLDIHYSLQHRRTFSQLVERMHNNFDPHLAPWRDVKSGMMVESDRQDFVHIQQELDAIWSTEGLHFNTEVLKEVVVLQEVLKTRLEYRMQGSNSIH